MLLVASVLVAALGTGVVGLWAITTANGKQPATPGSVPLQGASTPKPTPTTAPTTIAPGEKGVAVTLANPGLTPGQWIDVAVTGEGQRATILAPHAPVISVLADGRVLLALPESRALDVLSAISDGKVLTALLPAAGDGTKTAPAQASAASTSTGATTGSPTGSPTAPDEASSTP